MNKKTKVLSDHQLKGKKLIPPFFHALQGWEQHFNEVPYVNMVLPEIIWQAILNERYGVRDTADICLSFLKKVDNILGKSNTKFFCFLSNYESLNDTDVRKIKENCYQELKMIASALSAFVRVFPDCPIGVLFDTPVQSFSNQDVGECKRIINLLLEKVGKETTFSLANIIYYAFELGRLKVHKESSLLKLNSIHLYPTTEESKIVASTFRSTVNLFASQENFVVQKSFWRSYFWNRGHTIEPNKIENLYFD